MQIVTKTMTIGEVVQSHPEAVDIMLSRGFHCVGCQVSPFESIEQGAKGHGMSEADVDDLVAEINAKISTNPIVIKPPEQQGVELTPEASEKLKALMQKEGKTGLGLRISLVGGGCAGNSYEMDFDAPNPQQDRIFESHGLSIFYDNQFHDQIKGTQIHFRDGLKGAGFVMRNPNAKASCGCGSSFS